MRKILITGSDGFIGKNLISSISLRDDIDVIGFDTKNDYSELEQALLDADFIFHLAGVNRPQNTSDFQTGNKELTEKIIDFLIKKGKKTPILLSSSIQAAQDNAYGKSKLGAEHALQNYKKVTGSSIFIFRLHNAFGKWGKPNYNSVVATWCFNTVHGLPIQISDPDIFLSLIYIDDIISAFLRALDFQISTDEYGFCTIESIYHRSLGEIAAILNSFVESRTKLVMPPLNDEFYRKLYATWVSYLPENDYSYSLDIKKDPRGWLSEFIKSESFGQIFVSKTNPGITRGNHWHHTKVEKFLVISGKALIKFRKIGSEKVIEYNVDGNELQVIDIPPGVTHSITNIGDGELLTIFWSDEIFNLTTPDTFFLEV